MNASLVIVLRASVVRAFAVVAAALGAASLRAESVGVSSPLPESSPPARTDIVERGWAEPGRPASPAGDGAPKASPETTPEPGEGKAYSALQYAFFCFGPAFGNGSRGVDPNFIPPPTVTSAYNQSSATPRVRYTRVPTSTPGKAIWVGSDGSQISYSARLPRGDGRETGSGAGKAAASVGEIIAENRTEMAKISWARAHRRFPELAREDGAERVAFEAYLEERRTDPRSAPLFERPMWPEEVAAAFMSEWNWRKAEAESWERVRAKVRIFNDPESAYTRRFFEFTQGLRSYPEGSAIFEDPNWPEKALELHDQKLGPVPAHFR